MDNERSPQEKKLKRRSLQKWKSFPNRANSLKAGSRSKRWSKDNDADILQFNEHPLPKLAEEEEAVGIITMEDVIEELLQVINKYYLFVSLIIIFEFSCHLFVNVTVGRDIR